MDILKLAQENYDYAVKIRRHLHENPELTSFEFNTLELIKTELPQIPEVLEFIEFCENSPRGVVGGKVAGPRA